MKSRFERPAELPRIEEVPLDDATKEAIGKELVESGIRQFHMGKLLITTVPPGLRRVGWHMSMSRPDRLPSWSEIAKARSELLPHNMVFGMLLPTVDVLSSGENFTLQIHEIKAPGAK